MLTGLLLAGCGSASHLKSSAVVAANTHTPTAERHQVARVSSRAQAVAFASAVNLRSTDLPGFKTHKAKPEAGGEQHASTRLGRCVESGHTQAGVEQESDKFERETNTGSLDAGSNVDVAASARAAEEALASVRSPALGQCIKQALMESIASETGHAELKGASLHRVLVSTVTPPAPGAESFGWIAQATLRYRGIAFPFAMGFEGFVRGRAIVLLSTVALPGRFPQSLGQRLFATLLRRAETHSP
jgi:hypothetical protein